MPILSWSSKLNNPLNWRRSFAFCSNLKKQDKIPLIPSPDLNAKPLPQGIKANVQIYTPKKKHDCTAKKIVRRVNEKEAPFTLLNRSLDLYTTVHNIESQVLDEMSNIMESADKPMREQWDHIL